MTPNEFDDALAGLINQLLSQQQRAATALQRRSLARLIEKLEGLAKKGGNITPTVANLKEAKRIQASLSQVFDDPKFQREIESIAGEIQRIRLNIDKYLLETFGNEFNPVKTVVDDIVANAILSTRQTLSTVASSDAVPALEKVLNQYVTTGGQYTDLLQTVGEIIAGTEEKLGVIIGRTKQVFTDTIHQFTRNYIQSATRRIKTVFYLYSGGTVADTREFCAKRTGKYWHMEEIRGWGTTPKTWNGRNPETSPSTIFFLLGGYNCQHTLIPAALPSVPKSDLERMANKGLIPADLVNKKPAPEAGTDDKNISSQGVEFAPDVPGLKLTFSGKKVNGVEFPDEFFDNINPEVKFSKKLDGARGAHYNPNTKTVHISNKNKRWREGGEAYKKHVIAHEYGHAYHFEPVRGGRIIDMRGKIDPEFEDLVKTAQEELKAAAGVEDPSFSLYSGKESKQKINSWLSGYEKFNDAPYPKTYSKPYINSDKDLMDWVGIDNAKDAKEVYLSLTDTVEALTLGNAGMGHGSTYMNRGNFAYMEIFAEMNENFWVGNPIYKRLMPKTYEKGLQYFRKLYNL